MAWGQPFPTAAAHPWRIASKTYGEEGPLIMGILNLTPDSFYDGGKFFEADRALARARELVAEGADIIDVGAESTRPGAAKVSAEEEWERLSKVLPKLTGELKVPISIDTQKAEVASRALECGALIVNDVSGLQTDKNMAQVVARSGSSVVINHMQGTPESMQADPDYGNVVEEVLEFLTQRVDQLASLGVPREKVAVDPGIGFGKTVEHNYRLIRDLHRLNSLGCPVLLGPSRKSFIGKTPGLENSDRLQPTMAVCLYGALKGASVLRVHDPKPLKEQLLQIGVIQNSP